VKKDVPEKADVLKQFDKHVQTVVNDVAAQLDKFGHKAKPEINKQPIVAGQQDFDDAQKTFGKKHEEKKVAPKPIVEKKQKVEKDDSFGKKVAVKPKPVKPVKVEKKQVEPAAPILKKDVAEPESFGKKAERKMQSIVKDMEDAVQTPFGKLQKKMPVKVEKKKGGLPPMSDFMPNCLAHLEQLIRMVDRSYTDIHLQTVLENECMLEKDFPGSCDSGFLRHKHCTDFAVQLHDARWLELETGSDKGYVQACKDYYNLRMGINTPKQQVVAVVPFTSANGFDNLSMPKVSPTMHCIISLTFQYFGLFTLLTIVRTLNSFKYNLIGPRRFLKPRVLQ